MSGTPMLVCLWVIAGCGVAPQPADLIMTSGIVGTGVADAPPMSALAIRSGRIAHVGSDADISRCGPGTQRIDLRGRMMVPGFIDNHSPRTC